ncbi:MAG TPA: hypothetical protein VK001_09590 [Geminicoccaceae bacterium]|nr:hypothetical protein [Geminicoccaceae bacterium]
MEVLPQILPYIGWIIAGAVAVSLGGILASVHNTRLKIKNGYPIEGMWGQSLKPGTDAETKERVKLLTQENAQLRAEIGALQDRLVNVERIVTDSGYRLGHEIERLREEPALTAAKPGKPTN